MASEGFTIKHRGDSICFERAGKERLGMKCHAYLDDGICRYPDKPMSPLDLETSEPVLNAKDALVCCPDDAQLDMALRRYFPANLDCFIHPYYELTSMLSPFRECQMQLAILLGRECLYGFHQGLYHISCEIDEDFIWWIWMQSVGWIKCSSNEHWRFRCDSAAFVGMIEKEQVFTTFIALPIIKRHLHEHRDLHWVGGCIRILWSWLQIDQSWLHRACSILKVTFPCLKRCSFLEIHKMIKGNNVDAFSRLEECFLLEAAHSAPFYSSGIYFVTNGISWYC